MIHGILGVVYYREIDHWVPPSVFGENEDRVRSLPTLGRDWGPFRGLGHFLAAWHLGAVMVLRNLMVDTQPHCWV